MVMSQVLINDTTLTSIADAIREKNMSNPEYMKVTETITIGFAKRNEYYHFPFNSVKKVRFKARLYNLRENSNIITLSSSWNGWSEGQTNQIVLNPEYTGDTIEYDEIFEGNYIYLYRRYDTSNYQDVPIDLEITALDENGQEIVGRYSPSEMIDAIKAPSQFDSIMIQGNPVSGSSYKNYECGQLKLTADVFSGVQRIGDYAFYRRGIKQLELPEGIISIGDNAFYLSSITTNLLLLPSSLKKIGGYAFLYNSIGAFKILNKNSVIECDGNQHFKTGQTIYVPSNLYEDYKNHSYWGNGQDNLNLVPYGEWVSDPKISGSLLFNQSKSFTIELTDFETAPTFSITSSDQNIITVSNAVVNADNTAITFDVNSLTTEGNATINISIQGQEMSFDFTGNISVYETIPESTYEVVAVENASYGFELNDNGYYESKNKGVSSSYAICQVNILNVAGRKVYFDCINSGESNYDFGILSKVNTALSLTSNEDNSSNYFKSFKGQSSTNVQTVEYTDAIDNCFIQVKFIKDTSGDQGNDTLQFKVRFGE